MNRGDAYLLHIFNFWSIVNIYIGIGVCSECSLRLILFIRLSESCYCLVYIYDKRFNRWAETLDNHPIISYDFDEYLLVKLIRKMCLLEDYKSIIKTPLKIVPEKKHTHPQFCAKHDDSYAYFNTLFTFIYLSCVR